MKINSKQYATSVSVVSPALLVSCFGVCLSAAFLNIPKGEILQLRPPTAESQVRAFDIDFTPPDLDTLNSEVRAYRNAGQIEAAIACIERRRSEPGDIGRLPAELRDTYASLLLEADRAGDAFDFLRYEFESATSATTSTGASAATNAERLGSLLPTMVTAACFAERSAELPAYCDAYFSALPENQLPIPALAVIGRGGLSEFWTAFSRHAKRYATVCEWNDLHDRAFDYYLKCAALGDDFSLHRAVDLNEGLMRDAELADLLVELIPIAGQPEQALRLARMLGQAARYDEARQTYTDYLDSDPQSLQATFELAALEEEAGDLKSAMRHYLQARELAPDDTDLKVRIAALHLAFGERQRALEIYRSLPEHERADGQASTPTLRVGAGASSPSSPPLMEPRRPQLEL